MPSPKYSGMRGIANDEDHNIVLLLGLSFFIVYQIKGDFANNIVLDLNRNILYNIYVKY